jgi:hypothetical protein
MTQPPIRVCAWTREGRVKTTTGRVIQFKTSGYLEFGFWIVIMASAHDKLCRFQLYADLERLLICCRRECGYALSVVRSQVTSHLRGKHNVSADLRAGLPVM